MNKEDRKQRDRVAFILSEYKQIENTLMSKAQYYANKLHSKQEQKNAFVAEYDDFIAYKPRRVVSKYGVEFFYATFTQPIDDYRSRLCKTFYVLLDDGILQISTDGENATLITRHFMDRFLERMGINAFLEDFSIEKFLLAFFAITSKNDGRILWERNVGDFSLTHKDWYDACACIPDGMLCVRYVNDKYCVYKTFISKNEFKPSQMKKWKDLMMADLWSNLKGSAKRCTPDVFFDKRKELELEMLNKC